MAMRANTKRLTVAVAIGILMTSVSWLCNSRIALPLDPATGRFEFPWDVIAWFVYCVQRSEFPAFFVGTIFSGNIHQPSAVAAYLALFAQWTGVAYLLSLLVVRRSSPPGFGHRIRDAALAKFLPPRGAREAATRRSKTRTDEAA
jgi:hypothetical protein